MVITPSETPLKLLISIANSFSDPLITGNSYAWSPICNLAISAILFYDFIFYEVLQR